MAAGLKDAGHCNMDAWKIEAGWLAGVRRVLSPNFDERPPGEEISLLIVHGISLPPGNFGGPWIDQLFTNTLDLSAHAYFEQLRGLRVSAHALLRRDGECVQYVSFDRRAWHAGQSCYDGRQGCNDFSVGIELEGCDEQSYTLPQYTHLASVAKGLMAAYPGITAERIAGHSDIAPGRKTDPGPFFDWDRFRALL